MKYFKKLLLRKLLTISVISIGVSGGLIMMLLLFIILFISGIVGGANAQLNQLTLTNYSCVKAENFNESLFLNQFSNKGVFTNQGPLFIKTANEWHIDPVLLAAVAMLETGHGTSNAVMTLNNPGGLKINGKTHHFATLADGMRSMGKTLHTQVNELGRTTLEELGAVYAPIGDIDDINQTNSGWATNIKELATNFGGLTMNCQMENSVEIIGDKAWIVPFTKNIISGYEIRTITVNGITTTRLHEGIDIQSSGIGGQQVVAFTDGVVENSSYQEGGWGYYVKINHQNGMHTLYAHLRTAGIAVGQKVSAGEPVGIVGTTGHSTGEHLHFEVYQNNHTVDPLPYVTALIQTTQ